MAERTALVGRPEEIGGALIETHVVWNENPKGI
jgi:hypothetical protein